jgi:hypothetical protein
MGKKPNGVSHACNPSYLGGGDQEDHGSRPDKKLAWWQIPVVPATAGSINRRIAVQVSLGKKQDPIQN